MVLAKLVANERCTWSFEDVVTILREMNYRDAERQVVPFLRLLRDMKEWHPLSMFAERFAGQYRSMKGDVRQLVGTFDNLRETVTRNVEVMD